MTSMIKQLQLKQNTVWLNDRTFSAPGTITLQDIEEAEKRLHRFAPYLQEAFPALVSSGGLIESPLLPVPDMKAALEKASQHHISGEMWVKADHALPVSGSIKARGGIYEVLLFAETLALEKGLICREDNYAAFQEQPFRDLFQRYHILVGSTGNLGLSIGMISAKLGFRVTVHMSADAKQWKKDLLREKGAVVVEHKADYEKAVATGRLEAEKDPFAYFVDDEQSEALFIGYATAALRLKTQLEKAGVEPSVDKPLYVYLPCGIGGGPGGVAYGLNLLYGQAVQCFFAEPVESPCMLLGLATGRHDRISVYDIGLTNKTIADGLAVGRPSRFAGERVAPFIGGAYTVKDKQLLKLMALMAQAENIKIEPSAAAGLMGPVLIDAPKQATHLIWTTGGSMVPESVMNEEINRGRTLPDSVLQLNAAKA